jgi:hypothetical protein
MDVKQGDQRVGDIARKYEDSFQFLQARKKRQADQLKLLVNLQKGDQNIASTLLLTLLNRLVSATYDDKLQIKFLPSQGINQDQINSYNILAQSDYQEMNKAKLDYDWCWDTLFFGRGYMETLRFNEKRKIMEPHVINPLVFGYDPIVSEVQDWRYYWKWITKDKWQLEKLIKSGKITGIKDVKEIASGVEPYLWEYKQIIDQARYGVMPSPEPFSNDVFQLLEFFSYNDKGERCVYWMDKQFSKIIMEEELELDDGDGEPEDPGSKWPIVVKEAYRQPHSSIPFSAADLLDDKHRAESVLLNLHFIAAKDTANPIYLYNTDKVDDVAQFLSRQINQHIPVSDVDGAVQPLQKAPAMSADSLNFMRVLREQAEDPVGAGRPMMPAGGGSKQTATQASLDQQLNDMAQSLISKVMQFGESEFWSHWFHRYKKHGEALGSKMANVVGVKGVDSKEIELSVFHTDYPPGIMVYSAKEAEYKELVLRRDLMQLYPALTQTLDPDGIRNFNKHVFFPKFLQDPSLIDVMLPKTIDEIKAEEENEQLKQDVFPPISPSDNDTTHIYTHYMVQPKTLATWFHIAAHEEQLSMKKMQEQMMMQQEAMGQPSGALGGKGKVGAEKRDPVSQASPLATEMKNI